MSRTAQQSPAAAPDAGPFSPLDAAAYARWRADKLRCRPDDVSRQRVSIGRLDALGAAEREALVGACRRTNFALYRTEAHPVPDEAAIRAFGRQLGLLTLDRHLWSPEGGIVALGRAGEGGRADYIPYTDRAMGWHTDGYYNAPGAAVRGVIMHCVTPAASGGASWLLDPELVYIGVRDTDPALVAALMQPDVMTIPANELEPPARRRPAVTGPVFSVDPAGGALHMRYTARSRSIRWKDDPAARDAVALLDELLHPPVSFAFRVRLEAGEGILCNNVLHAREAFTDDPAAGQQRLLWRARYRERIAGTAPSDAGVH
ncbi:MAG: TauD/TfdA family dioxygenase [Gammaproteobacteria bacterium]|nr:TauD/TfdA family dioxygenase [Gammaproteobacteria bacterium]